MRDSGHSRVYAGRAFNSQGDHTAPTPHGPPMSELSEVLRLFTTNSGRRAQLDVGGELDLATVEAFREHLELLVESATGEVDVDMALVTFCDATTLNVLVAAHHRLASAGRHLRIINASQPVLRLLELAGLDALLLGPTEGDAHPSTAALGTRERWRDHGNVALGRGRSSPVPIDKRVSGAQAELILRRATTNGETTVVVVGDFNDWTPGAHPMTGGADGWTCTLTVPVGRRYRFRYLLDGERWENDWEADDYVDNDHGGQDSVIDVA